MNTHGGGRETPTPSARDAEEKAGGGWGRHRAPTPGRGDEGSMGAKESRIGFLSYEEALRRGEGGGGVWASCRGGRRRAALRVGDRGRGGELEGVGPEAEGKGGHDGDTVGEKGRVGAVFGDWDRVDGGEAFPERGVSGASRALPLLCGGVVILDVSREVPPPSFSWVAPALPAPLILYCHFLLSLLHKPSSNILTSYLTTPAGKGDGRRLQSPPFAK